MVGHQAESVTYADNEDRPRRYSLYWKCEEGIDLLGPANNLLLSDDLANSSSGDRGGWGLDFTTGYTSTRPKRPSVDKMFWTEVGRRLTFGWNGAAVVGTAAPPLPCLGGDSRELRGGSRRKVRPLLPVNRGGVLARRPTPHNAIPVRRFAHVSVNSRVPHETEMGRQFPWCNCHPVCALMLRGVSREPWGRVGRTAPSNRSSRRGVS
jgi:hypothetical protein